MREGTCQALACNMTGLQLNYQRCSEKLWPWPSGAQPQPYRIETLNLMCYVGPQKPEDLLQN